MREKTITRIVCVSSKWGVVRVHRNAYRECSWATLQDDLFVYQPAEPIPAKRSIQICLGARWLRESELNCCYYAKAKYEGSVLHGPYHSVRTPGWRL